MQRTKTDAALEQAEQAHADDPERAELLKRARRFKTSWIELAEALTAARKHGSWQRWGYDSLEAYAKTELRLRPETVDKLTGSYSFLQRRVCAARFSSGTPAARASMPSYQAVDFLRRARGRGEDAPRDTVEEIRRRVLEEAAPMATVSRAYSDVVFPIDEATKRERDLAGVKNVTKRLRELLAETRAVPRKLASEVSASLDTLLEAIEKREEAAA